MTSLQDEINRLGQEKIQKQIKQTAINDQVKIQMQSELNLIKEYDSSKPLEEQLLKNKNASYEEAQIYDRNWVGLKGILFYPIRINNFTITIKMADPGGTPYYCAIFNNYSGIYVGRVTRGNYGIEHVKKSIQECVSGKFPLDYFDEQQAKLKKQSECCLVM